MNYVDISHEANVHLTKWIQSQKAIGLSLRLKTSGCSGFQYEIEPVQEKPLGVVTQAVDEYALFIDASQLQKIQGTEIKLEKMSLGQTRLRFHNPRATGWCGCGESFQVKE